MLIDIRTVPSLNRKIGGKRYKLYGMTTFQSPDKTLIEIAQDKNETIDVFSVTLLHEMLHVWLTMIKSGGATIDLRKDHKFIYAVEDMILKLAQLLKLRRIREKKK